jgi:hypothetical protein
MSRPTRGHDSERQPLSIRFYIHCHFSLAVVRPRRSSCNAASAILCSRWRLFRNWQFCQFHSKLRSQNAKQLAVRRKVSVVNTTFKLGHSVLQRTKSRCTSRASPLKFTAPRWKRSSCSALLSMYHVISRPNVCRAPSGPDATWQASIQRSRQDLPWTAFFAIRSKASQAAPK